MKMHRRIGSLALTVMLSVMMVFTLVPMTGTNTAYAFEFGPGVNIGTDILKKTSNKSTLSPIVHMGGKTWRVVGYDGTGAASPANTMTMLGWGDFGTTDFSAEFRNINYAESLLKTKTEAFLNSFTAEEKAILVPKTLQSGVYDGNNTDCIAGPEVKDALLWPLSIKEAKKVDQWIRQNEPRSWWLRSPGEAPDVRVAYVSGPSVMNYGEFPKNFAFPIRPAFNAEYDPVVITTTAVGGKTSGTVGADSLKQVEPNTSGEWKLTLNSGHDDFQVDAVTQDSADDPIQIEYSGAVPGNEEYISAIVTNADGVVTYYGNLKKCTSSDDASGTVTINNNGKIGCADSVYIFNEHLNGDKKTDTSSELVKITVPYLSHTLAETKRVDPTCTVPGTDAYWTCSVCDKLFSEESGTNKIDEPAVLPAIGHKYGAWKKLDDNQHQRVCGNDATHVETGDHTWNNGKVTKKATEKETGVKTYTCTACKATKTETIPKLKPTPKKDTTPKKSSATKVSGALIATATAKGKSALTVKWTKVEGAAGYDVFFALCNHHKKEIKCKKVKTFKGNKTFTWAKSGLKKDTAYKVYVKAYIVKNGKKTYVRTSPMAHAYTGGQTKNFTNAKAVTVNKSSVTLKKGKTFKIKASVVKINKNKKLMPTKHAPTIRYMTSNKNVAAVSAGGKITAKSKGTCTIYAYPHNGAYKTIKVTVK